MDHNEVVRQKLTEKYLLEELAGETRDEFEEHFFECSECALDIRAGSEFVTHSKFVLAESAEQPARERVTSRSSGGYSWLGWLRTQFAAPALAFMILVVGYQNLVTYPRLRGAAGTPQVLPWAAVTVGTYGPSGPTITVAKGKGFLLFVRIPPEASYVRYMADLYNPAGKLECSLAIPANATEDRWSVLVPGGNREAGDYRVSVRGVTASGASKDVGSAPFTLQIQK